VVLFILLAMCKAAGCWRCGGAAVPEKRLVVNVLGEEIPVAPPRVSDLDSIITVASGGGAFVVYVGADGEQYR